MKVKIKIITALSGLSTIDLNRGAWDFRPLNASTVASMLLFWDGALEVHHMWLRCSWCRIHSNIWLHSMSIHLECLILLWTMNLQSSLRKHISDNTRTKPLILEVTRDEPKSWFISPHFLSHLKLLLGMVLIMISLGFSLVEFVFLICLMPQLPKFLQLLLPFSTWMWWRSLGVSQFPWCLQ